MQMLINVHIVFVVTSGLCVGGIVGSFISTKTENEVRTGRRGFAVFSNMSPAGIFLNAAIIGLLICCAVAVGVLSLGHAYPLDRQILALSILVGGGLAKWARYRYWKRRKHFR
jgi:hypothetical protein